MAHGADAVIGLTTAAGSPRNSPSCVDTSPRVPPWPPLRPPDLILIPSRPTINDLETIATTQSLINGPGGKAKVAVIHNDIPPQGQQRQQAEDAITAGVSSQRFPDISR